MHVDGILIRILLRGVISPHVKAPNPDATQGGDGLGSPLAGFSKHTRN
jgi:hypothetical protein